MLAGPSSAADMAVCSELAGLVSGPQMTSPQCTACSSPLSRPWACLTCSFVGCMGAYSLSPRQCFEDHFAESDDCLFAVDSVTGAVLCSICDDTHYLESLSAIYDETLLRLEEDNDLSQQTAGLPSGKGRKRAHYHPWVESSQSDSTRMPCRGLRPLLNLSQTCFLSAILQALIHNPLLKAYFMSDKHNRVGQDRERGCMCCELDRAFEEFHADDKSPYGPVTMLYAMWHASAELEGYGQQDAHSFFLAALDQIHAHARGQSTSCTCIAHQTFAGSLLSSVTCSSCHTTSTTVDPILDIQLDFPPSSLTNPEPLTLPGMLRRFCAEEKVGDHGGKGYDCSSCGGGSGAATRKLLIKRLPPVLAFQLKRFGHHNSTSTKVEVPVRFPSTINMAPYVEHGSSIPSSQDAQKEQRLPDSVYLYDLFAVVTHEGKLDNGHYWADVLSGDEWWHCDDDKVTPTTLSAVQGQKAYLLFYAKRTLAYADPIARLLNPIPAGAAANKMMPDGIGNKGVVGDKGVTKRPDGSKGLKGKGLKGKSVGDKHAEDLLRSGKSGHPIRGMEI
ncbi:ubiquitin carboxyl-terminal hydrolase 22/27/51 [Tremella mesenterica]|uniref:Ubiquitin carboxyl-terminal hydrolase 22/27/51 n=1 Tax=Tremella mesenterica TaxID=5217 RepID=A0A4Q1BHR8_TREME|nr:ubiquitin carboxyl-terminal hydrolase 22/27/51 [Tremella mesenterica]